MPGRGGQQMGERTRVCLLCGNIYRAPHRKSRNLLCNSCRTRRNSNWLVSWQTNVYRAEQHGLPSTLTFREWMETCHDFGFRCVYCGRRATLLEHFIPIAEDGGTTVGNCIPACRSCNSRKDRDDRVPIPKSSLEKVRRYLRRRTNAETDERTIN